MNAVQNISADHKEKGSPAQLPMEAKSLFKRVRQFIAAFGRKTPNELTDEANGTPQSGAGIGAIFRDAYASGIWGRDESRSGFGSNLIQTAVIRTELPRLLAELRVRSFLDIPCGDWFWMKHVDLGVETYIGADVVPDLIQHHKKTFGRRGRDFRVLDVTSDRLPKVDMIFCRDCLVHFSSADALKAMKNIKRSGSRY